MEHLPKLITDLALILMSAGVVTLIFKRLHQPLVLGYIVAGFLAGPSMPYTPSIADTGNLDTWAEIGVIFIMFTLGLEFSFKKVVKMGGRPIIAACTIIFFMISLGTLVGTLFSWKQMDCLFLGGMLAMSSTTIIYKAFEDMGVRQQRFAGQVLSVLVLEDILGILLMVVLSTLAVSRHFEGAELMGSLFQLLLCLIVWFIVGVFLIPLFLRKNRKWINKETLLIVSLGLCFAMVVLAVYMGYSSAFGAFMMGSILAETVEAESINNLVKPVKDLFGAVFFVSVGMLVDPLVLIDYIVPILAITTTILIGQCLFGSLGFLLSGQPLKVAMQCGFSMTQIGEFAFIIASLGVSLGVTSHFLYPIVVAVSVITTFLTPYTIRLSEPAFRRIERAMPGKMRHVLNELSPGDGVTSEDTAWRRLLSALTKQVVSYAAVSVTVILIAFTFILPIARNLLTHWWGNAFCGIITLLAVSPFLRAIVMRKNHSEDFRLLWKESRINRFPLIFTIMVRFLISCSFIFYIINYLSPLASLVHWIAAFAIMIFIILCKQIKKGSINLEHTFLQNLHSRETLAEVKGDTRPRYAEHLLSHDVHLTEIEIPTSTQWGGFTLKELNIGHNYGIMIASILRGEVRINIPGAETRLFPGDRIQIIGNDTNLKAFAQHIKAQEEESKSEEYSEIEEKEIILRCLEISDTSPFLGKTVRESGIRDKFHCMLVGFDEGEEQMEVPRAERIFSKGDLVWVVGEREAVKRLLYK